MPRTPVKDELPAGVPDDSGHDSDRHVSFGQHGSLLDVELEERPRKLPASRNARAASDASDFLPAKDHDGARTDALDSLDCRDDAECTVEAAALRDAVEVRADPAGTEALGMSEEVAVAVDLDFEPRLLEPASRDAMRLVLGGGGMRPVRAEAATDRVQLVEPLESAHELSLVGAQRAQPAPADHRQQRSDPERDRPRPVRHRGGKADRREHAEAGEHATAESRSPLRSALRRRARPPP